MDSESDFESYVPTGPPGPAPPGSAEPQPAALRRGQEPEPVALILRPGPGGGTATVILHSLRLRPGPRDSVPRSEFGTGPNPLHISVRPET